MIERVPQESFKEEGSSPQPLPPSLPATDDLSAADLAILNDEAKQSEFRRQFALQMARRHCPGCGE